MNGLKKYYFRLNESYEQKQEDKRPIEKQQPHFLDGTMGSELVYGN